MALQPADKPRRIGPRRRAYEVSITASSEDGFDDSVTGLASQFTQAINDAGIDGVTATLSSGVVTLVPKITIADALITNDEGTAETSIVSTSGDQTSATLTITSTDDLMEIGDKVSFSVQGNDFEITVGEDGFKNTMAGVAEQMKSVVDAAGLTGVTVAASSTITAGVARIANVQYAVGNVAATSDTTTINIGATAITYTAAGNNETLATIVAGLNTADGGANAVFSVGDDGTSINVTLATAGVNTDAITAVSAVTTASTTTAVTTQAGVAASAANTAVLTITNAPVVSGTGTGGSGPSVTLEDGTLTLGGEVSSGDTIAFTLDGTSVSVTAYNTSLSDTASMLVSAINQNSGGSIIASMNDDGSIAVSKSSGSASVMSSEAALSAIDNIDAAISTLNTQRANLGALSNRLDNTVSNLSNVAINLEAGKGRIEDADFAAESTAMSKAQILQQASTAMLAQANASKQNVLSLLQG